MLLLVVWDDMRVCVGGSLCYWVYHNELGRNIFVAALVWVLGMCCPVISVQYGNCVAAFNDLYVWFVKVPVFCEV